MNKKKKGRFGNLNFLGIPIDSTLGVGDKVLDHIDESKEAEKRKEAASKYWVRCPSCEKRVVKKELIKKGCYACGWKGTEEEIELAQAKRKSGKVKFEVEKVGLPEKKRQSSYYTTCPKCGRKVITKELEEKGCFVCGYKPEGG
jgi:acetyl-CoA carboxylase beta subunit